MALDSYKTGQMLGGPPGCLRAVLARVEIQSWGRGPTSALGREEARHFLGFAEAGLGAGLYGAEKQGRQGAPQTLRTLQGGGRVYEVYLMSSLEQPSTGKSILFSTFSAEQLLFITSHTSSVLLGAEMVLWPWSQT